MPPHPDPLPDALPVVGAIPTSVISRRGTLLRAEATAAEAARPPTGNPLRWFGRIVADVVRKSDRDRLLGLAAETAFFAVLTLFPALLVATSVLGQLGAVLGQDTADQVERAVLDFLDTLLTDTARPVTETVAGLFESGTNALTFASLLALVSLSTAFSAVINTVNIASDVPETRGWWRRRWLGLLLGTGTVITGAIAVTLLVVGPLFGRALDYLESRQLDAYYYAFLGYARLPIAFTLLVLWAATLAHLAPARRPRWRDGLPGALLTGLLWLAASLGLNVYLEVVVTASPILGALGGGLILMTWFYLLCAGLLIGVELNTILLARKRHRMQIAPAPQLRERDPLTEPAPGARELTPDLALARTGGSTRIVSAAALGEEARRATG